MWSFVVLLNSFFRKIICKLKKILHMQLGNETLAQILIATTPCCTRAADNLGTWLHICSTSAQPSLLIGQPVKI